MFPRIKGAGAPGDGLAPVLRELRLRARRLALVLGLYVMDVAYFARRAAGKTPLKDSVAVAVFVTPARCLHSTATEGGRVGSGERDFGGRYRRRLSSLSGPAAKTVPVSCPTCPGAHTIAASRRAASRLQWSTRCAWTTAYQVGNRLLKSAVCDRPGGESGSDIRPRGSSGG